MSSPSRTRCSGEQSFFGHEGSVCGFDAYAPDFFIQSGGHHGEAHTLNVPSFRERISFRSGSSALRSRSMENFSIAKSPGVSE